MNFKFNVHKSSSLAFIGTLSSTVNHHPYYFLFMHTFFTVKSLIPILLVQTYNFCSDSFKLFFMPIYMDKPKCVATQRQLYTIQ